MKSIFKTVDYKKLEWLGNATDSGGAMAEIIKNKTPNNIVMYLHNSKLGRLWTSSTQDNLLNLIKKNIGIYEVITHYQHKVYFDIDKDEATTQEYLNKIMDKINELFPNNDSAISGSITED